MRPGRLTSQLVRIVQLDMQQLQTSHPNLSSMAVDQLRSTREREMLAARVRERPAIRLQTERVTDLMLY